VRIPITSLDAVAVLRDTFKQLLGHLPGVSGTMQAIMSKRIEAEPVVT